MNLEITSVIRSFHSFIKNHKKIIKFAMYPMNARVYIERNSF